MEESWADITDDVIEEKADDGGKIIVPEESDEGDQEETSSNDESVASPPREACSVGDESLRSEDPIICRSGRDLVRINEERKAAVERKAVLEKEQEKAAIREVDKAVDPSTFSANSEINVSKFFEDIDSVLHDQTQVQHGDTAIQAKLKDIAEADAMFSKIEKDCHTLWEHTIVPFLETNDVILNQLDTVSDYNKFHDFMLKNSPAFKQIIELKVRLSTELEDLELELEESRMD